MFTGLVRELGHVETTVRRGSIQRVGLRAPGTAKLLTVGDSLAVNGVCLTVTGLEGSRVVVEATEETRRVTTLGRWRRGNRVHLEPSLRVGDSVGGHFVLGHVDGIGRVMSLRRLGRSAILRIALAERLAAQLVPKGSIAVDGVSLTLDEGPFDGAFEISLIPHTLGATRFGSLLRDDEVNLELDVLAKAARAAVLPRARPPERSSGGARGITIDRLLQQGWRRLT